MLGVEDSGGHAEVIDSSAGCTFLLDNGSLLSRVKESRFSAVVRASGVRGHVGWDIISPDVGKELPST